MDSDQGANVGVDSSCRTESYETYRGGRRSDQTYTRQISKNGMQRERHSTTLQERHQKFRLVSRLGEYSKLYTDMAKRLLDN